MRLGHCATAGSALRHSAWGDVDHQHITQFKEPVRWCPTGAIKQIRGAAPDWYQRGIVLSVAGTTANENDNLLSKAVSWGAAIKQ